MTDPRERLDDPAALREADPEDMLGRLAAFPDMLERARLRDLPVDWEFDLPPCERMLVGGMGGSAIAGAVLAGFYGAGGGRGHLQPVRDYRLPPLRAGDGLVLCSYSGNTEEALALYAAAEAEQLPTLVVTSGGRLGELAATAGRTSFGLPPGHPPRAAFPALLGRLLAIGAGLGFHESADEGLSSVLSALTATAARCAPERPLSENPAKSLALALGKARPVFCALAAAYEPVALRLRCQMEENAERAALDRALPELHHNSWVPWTAGDPLGAPLWLGAADAHSRTLLRRNLSDERLAESGIPALELPAAGECLLARLLTTVLLGDYLSVYHALMRGLNPTPVTPLAAMKARLAEFQEPS